MWDEAGMNRVRIKAVLMVPVLIGACGEGTASVAVGADQTRMGREERRMVNAVDSGEPRRQLPFSHGRSFATLDDYLAHLRERAGPIGQPWYRQIGQNRYELVTTRVPPGEPETLTRAQLMERFGFSR